MTGPVFIKKVYPIHIALCLDIGKTLLGGYIICSPSFVQHPKLSLDKNLQRSVLVLLIIKDVDVPFRVVYMVVVRTSIFWSDDSGLRILQVVGTLKR